MFLDIFQLSDVYQMKMYAGVILSQGNCVFCSFYKTPPYRKCNSIAG